MTKTCSDDLLLFDEIVLTSPHDLTRNQNGTSTSTTTSTGHISSHINPLSMSSHTSESAQMTQSYPMSTIDQLLSSPMQGLSLSPALTPASVKPVVSTVTTCTTGTTTSNTSNIPSSPDPVDQIQIHAHAPDAAMAESLDLRPEDKPFTPDNEVVTSKVQSDPLLIPRAYQNELFRKALNHNIIAVMDTGTGKTLVAVMLIKAMAERELAAKRTPEERKLGFFVVNNVPLVFQQAEVIRTNSPYQVIELCGQKQAKKYSEDLWKQVYEDADIVVLTAQILLDLLRHGFIKMRKIHLLIFDECHHARENHPFALIMREHYHQVPMQDRPKIFGMTASPSPSVGTKLYHSAKELEELLASKIFTIDQVQVQAYVERPSEFIVQYNSPPAYQNTKLTVELRERCSMVPKLEGLFSTTEFNLKHLGPWCVDRLWRLYLDILADKKGMIPVSDDIKLAKNIVTARPPTPPKLEIAYMSPKVLKLAQLLRVAIAGLDEEFCGIVFVERRETAIALCLLLQELDEFQDDLRVEVLAGHNEDSDVRVLKMDFRSQAEIITRFKTKQYNLLVATSVAEEGLDIQPCNFVVRFDPAPNIISYIQSRGRARKKNSRYIVMQEYGIDESPFEKIRYSEKSMREWCKTLDPDQVCRDSMETDYDSTTNKALQPQMYRVESTGAIVTLESAVPLVHTYCNTLSGDEFCSLQPIFREEACGTSGFTCELTLPANAPIRRIYSDRVATKALARKNAAFQACEKLHTLGALNDNLLPIMVELSKEEELEDIKSADLNDKNKTYPMATPAFWNNEHFSTERVISLYGNIIELEQKALEELGGKNRYRTQCLLTYKPLPCDIPPLNLHIEGRKRQAKVRSLKTPIQITKEQHEQLRQFTLNLFHRMCRRSFESSLEDIPYFVAPLQKDYTEEGLLSSISWDDVKLGQSLSPLDLVGELEHNSSSITTVVTLRLDHGRDFFIKKILHGFQSDHVMPKDLFRQEYSSWDDAIAKGKTTIPEPSVGSSSGTQDEDGARTFAQYFKFKYNVDCLKDDIILQVERVRKMRNHLQPVIREEERREEEKQEESSITILPLSACMRCAVRADVLRMAQLIPSVLFSLDSTLLTFEAQQRLNLPEIQLHRLQEAFTASSANRDFQYQRLELLGDSFLKFSSTIRLYIVNPSKDEGQLHASRIRVISNNALLRHATNHELFLYVSSTPFHRKNWRPTRFTVDGKAWKDAQRHSLSNKMLADIIEATLGAAYLSGGVRTGLKAAKTLGVPFDEFRDWDDFHHVYQSRQAAEVEGGQPKPELTLINLFEVEKTIGYKFKNPLLFIEAMTHASHIYEDSVCYQRLEFLGDAVLDFQVIQHYYKKYDDAPPGAITLVKDASVNNQVLGVICIKWGLHKFLRHCSSALLGAITTAINALEAQRKEALAKGMKGEYWLDVPMPKVLGDLVESTLGAVFVDSGFDFAVISDLFRRLIQPFLDEHISTDSIVIHPKKRLLEMLQAQGCNNFKFESENEDQGGKILLRKFGLRTPGQSDESDVPLKSHFKIHGNIMATATGDHIDKLDKEVAYSVIAKLENDPELLSRICTCPKRRGARHVSMLDKYRGK
ncbi:Dicer-like protein 1 [Lobosporangium transversale]|nr:Dicer-like protein 1 [Lobosporangium transversale]